MIIRHKLSELVSVEVEVTFIGSLYLEKQWVRIFTECDINNGLFLLGLGNTSKT